MTTRKEVPSKTGLRVSTKISLGFTIVLVLHVSIAVLGHYGLNKAKRDLETYDALRRQIQTFDAIDRVVSELQRNVLLFAFTGYEGPEVRATELHDDLENLLETAGRHHLSEVNQASIHDMQSHLSAHREIFEAVVIDRAKRRHLVNDVLTQYGRDFDESIQGISDDTSSPHVIGEIKAEFRAAEFSAMQFVNGPDSTHVRAAKSHLTRAKNLIGMLGKDAAPRVRKSLEAMTGYEESLIQMVQATRGYLHLVNVVLAGESTEFRRLASNLRTTQSTHVGQLAKTMADDSRRFESSSNIFSVITIILGIAAAWLIGRDVAPPLNAIARTFDELTRGQSCSEIPGLGRRDELGRLAKAAQVFKNKAAETERLLSVAKLSEEELNELNAQLATQTELAKSMANEATAATLAKSEFLANMSHEIRTPMTAILGFSETVLENVNQPENVEGLKTIRRNGEYLLGIVNDILDISKIESGKLEVEQIDFSPKQILRDVISMMAVRAEAKSLELELVYDGAMPMTIRSDPTRLRQILINILGNAIKFTEIGSVRLVTRFVDENPGEPKLQFDVTDTGIGLSPEQISKLFQPFIQADTSTTRKFGGTGLGLTISKRLAEMLGGDISVQSRPNEGSTFSVTVSTGPLDNVEMTDLSVDEGSRIPPALKTSPADDLRLNCRVLLAEDGPDNQRLISFFLKKTGAEVTVVGNGQEALDTALSARDEGRSFDLILMDMQMPVMGGYEATTKLRESAYGGPVIALTAHAMASDRQKCLDAGCNDYTTKPVVRDHLISLVSQYTSQQTVPDEEEPAHVV